jgi:hypothetical protein
MSATPGKVSIEGVANINNEKVFVLNFLQGRNAYWVKRPFFAKYDRKAKWLNELVPAFGKEKFFFEDELRNILNENFQKHSLYKNKETGLVEEGISSFGAA